MAIALLFVWAAGEDITHKSSFSSTRKNEAQQGDWTGFGRRAKEAEAHKRKNEAQQGDWTGFMRHLEKTAAKRKNSERITHLLDELSEEELDALRAHLEGESYTFDDNGEWVQKKWRG